MVGKDAHWYSYFQISILQKYDYGNAGIVAHGVGIDFNSTEVRLWSETEGGMYHHNSISILQKYDYGRRRAARPVAVCPFQFYRSTIMVVVTFSP